VAILMQWLPWILLIGLLVLFWWVGALAGQVAEMRMAVAGKKRTNRQELEALYTAGSINRDEYERWKDRVK
jgi:uncharacterized membrane protein